MKERLGWGVAGAGAIGIRCALSHFSQPDVQDRAFLAAVCDPVPGRAEAAAKKFGVAAHYLTFEELLADPRVDMVTLCSPIGLHYEQGMKAVEAGKHVHFNKTMTTTVAEADRLIARAAEKGVKLVASPGQMLFPHNQRLRRLILEGTLGRLAWAATGTAGVGEYHMKEEFRTGQDILTDVNPSWYFKKPGGGPQYDVTVYCLHTLTGILGPARRVTALSGMQIAGRDYHGQKIACEIDDTTMLLLDFGDSFFAFVYACVAGGGLTPGFQPNIYGTKGSIIGTKFRDQDMKKPNEFPPHVTGPHAALREFHVFEDMMQLTDWVREGKPSIASAEHARHVIDIIEAGYRAAETGQTQDLRTSFTPLPLDSLESRL
ncbi:MAG: Gfo/Idh/MocA family oxidoreductase [Planctomycetes bacterium]|nr:Gfo/Idh/MocA family oxidoreductase [Planctomycetota bacterium]